MQPTTTHQQTRELATFDAYTAIIEAAPNHWTRAQVEIAKQTVCRELNDVEFLTFMMIAARTGLDVFSKQIYAIKRAGVMTIQTGIDGYNATASKTRELAGVDPIEYDSLDADQPKWAKATVYRRYPDGYIARFSYTARWREYVQLDRDGKPANMWRKMPFVMLGKCALARAFRLGFPAELSGVYTREEMDQADSYTPAAPVVEAARVYSPPQPAPAPTHTHNVTPIRPASVTVSPTATTVDGLIAIATPPQQPQPQPTTPAVTLNQLYQDALALGLSPAQWTKLKAQCNGDVLMIDDMLRVMIKKATQPARELDHEITTDSDEGLYPPEDSGPYATDSDARLARMMGDPNAIGEMRGRIPDEDSADPVVTPAMVADMERHGQSDDAQSAVDAFNAEFESVDGATSGEISMIRAGAVASLQRRMAAIGWSVDVQERFTQRHVGKVLDENTTLTPDDFHKIDATLADYEQKHAAKTDNDLRKMNTGRGNRGRN